MQCAGKSGFPRKNSRIPTVGLLRRFFISAFLLRRDCAILLCMPIPPLIAARVIAYVLQTARRAYRMGRVVQKFVARKFGKYVVEIERRGIVGADGGLSQVVRFLLKDKTQEACHVVVKGGKVIHQHIFK